jgi:hypothetical protein
MLRVRCRAVTPSAPPVGPDRRRRTTLVVLVGALLLSMPLWWIRWHTGPEHPYPDSFWYARQAATLIGESPADARRFAAGVECNEFSAGVVPACIQQTYGWTDAMPARYQAIFTSRPGYALLTAPFVAVLGGRGFVLATILIALAAGVLIAYAVRLLGGSPLQSWAATVMLFLLPTGYWITRLLAESAAITATLLALCGVTVLLTRASSDSPRRADVIAGTAVVVGLALLILSKPATGLLLSAAFALATGVLAGWTRLRRRANPSRRLLIALGASGGVTVAWLAASSLLGLPGASDTLQDTFTNHFEVPDVPDPWTRLLDLNRTFWPDQLSHWLNDGIPLAASTFLAVLVFGLAALAISTRRSIALVWGMAAVAAMATVAAHPVVSEIDRLVVFAWLPVVLGLALVLRRPGTAPTSGSAIESSEVEAPSLVATRT